MIPEHLIEQIAQANDIVDVISGYFPLKRAGSAYKARCPFHQEKTPSFNVNPARQTFKCFGCGAGGGVIKFVQLYENLNFPEAVKRLGARAGIRVEDEPLSAEELEEQSLRTRLLSLHAAAAEWFHKQLLRSQSAQHARDYLKGRGLNSGVAKDWNLGYSPDTWDAFTRWARGNGYRDDELIASGLVTFKKDDQERRIGDLYDRFRDRLMFPICDDIGQVIAFSGRVLSAEAFGGKYVNSPETPIFIKGKVLFGLHKTKRALIDKKTAIVLEGQIDLITAFEAGVTNVTAAQGTAFTSRHARVLKRYVDDVVLCFDADAAGMKAAEKSLPTLLEAGLSVRVAEMPAGHDPDSLIRAEGAEAFASRIDAARDFFDYKLERGAASPEFATPRGKTNFARQMAASVSLVADPMLRDAIVHNVASRLEMSPDSFLALVKEAPARYAEPSGDEAEPELPPAPEPMALSNTTRLLCILALTSPEGRCWILEQPWEAQLSELPEAELLVLILGANLNPAEPAAVSAWLSTLNTGEQAALAGLLEVRSLPEDPLRVASDCWRDLERRTLEQKREAATARMHQSGLDPEETVRLQREVMEIQRQLGTLLEFRA
ncbi:MAG: DNA primase [Chthoniobacteraceae bacterium]